MEEVEIDRQFYLSCEVKSSDEYENVCKERGGEALHSFYGKEGELLTIIKEIGGRAHVHTGALNG